MVKENINQVLRSNSISKTKKYAIEEVKQIEFTIKKHKRFTWF